MTNIAAGNQEFVNSLIGNIAGDREIIFRTFGGLGFFISKAYEGACVAIANDESSLITADIKFQSSKSNHTLLNKWHVISVISSDKEENLSNCLSNGEKLITFTSGNVKGSDYCYIGNLGEISSRYKTHLTGCIGEIIRLHTTLKDEEILYIQEHLMTKWGITERIVLKEYCYAAHSQTQNKSFLSDENQHPIFI